LGRVHHREFAMGCGEMSEALSPAGGMAREAKLPNAVCDLADLLL
jgi:hypothetical protein